MYSLTDSAFLAPLVEDFDPKQPRDALGKWRKVGKGSGYAVYVLDEPGRDMTRDESLGAAFDPQDREWAVTRFPPGIAPSTQSGENLDWVDSLKTAKGEVESRVRQRQKKVKESVEPVGLPPLEEEASKNSLLLKGRGRPSANLSKRERRIANTVPAKDGDFEKKHPRGKTGSPEGGRFIRKGTSGPAVRAIQRRVGAEQDGAFGPKTAAAVRAFQQKNGLRVDGIVGRETAAALLGARRIPKPGALRPGQAKSLRGLSRRKKVSPVKARRTGGGVVIR